MTEPLGRPRRKNPLRRTTRPTLPPAGRSRTAQHLTRAAAEGRFALQRCAECGAFLYPAHDACPVCLSADLPFVDAPRGGVLLSTTTVHVPAEPYFRERTPWRMGLVKLDCGPNMVASLHGDCREGEAVRLSLQLDKAGQALAFAHPAVEAPNMEDDCLWRELTADPKFRRVLITNGRSTTCLEIAKALMAAGAASVHVGIPDQWKPLDSEEALRKSGAVLIPLDATDERSVARVAGELGGKVDILVNTAEHIRPGGLLEPHAPASARDAVDQHFLGFVHLARAFGPAMRMRGADGTNNAVAWVNVLSVYALASWPAFGVYSAAQAACLSLSHCLRAELRAGGVKVLNIFAGPIDTDWFQTMPPPKLSPRAIATALVASLRAGTEDVFVGDIAEDFRQRLLSNPKGLERELGAS